ncbi:MAG: hypothetical protein SF053_01990 [Bacteroidia bacterium]|nr:hypothetical protein [Bacteroidia bacterium]
MRISLMMTLVLSLYGLHGLAQEPDQPSRKAERAALRAQRTHYLSLDAGTTYGQTLDARMAANRYFGAGLQLAIGGETQSPRGLKQTRYLDTRFLVLVPSHVSSMTFNTFNESYGTYFRNVRTLGAWTLRAGGGWSVLANARINPSLGNSAFNTDAAVSAVAAGNLNRAVRLPLLGTWDLAYTLRLPLVSYLNRLPAYGLSGLGGTSSFVVPVGVFTRVNSSISLTRPISKGNPNLHRFAYAWDFYAFNDNEIHPLRVANHTLTYTLLIRTGKITTTP